MTACADNLAPSRRALPFRYIAVGLVSALVVLVMFAWAIAHGLGTRTVSGFESRADLAHLTGRTAFAPVLTAGVDASRDGAVQRVSVDVSSGGFSPNRLAVRAGVPVTITFSRGTGCATSVRFERLGVAADLSGGSRTVELPALAPGVYTFTCALGTVSGVVVAR